jgi:hypothetical protein
VSNTNFFHEMPAMTHLRDITKMSYYVDVPEDWHVALTDVVGSTRAIEEGRYKSVNTVAAVTITAILNSIPNIDVPFLFGGDGASVLVPPEVAPLAREALSAVKRLARVNFNLEVRAGLVPMKDILAAGHSIKVSKIMVSEQFNQPVFTGGGLDYADALLKSAQTSERYAIPEKLDAKADFSGFECRWSKHPASNGEVLSLLVKSTAASLEERHRIYEHIIEKIHEIYGDANKRHPIDVQKMRVATDIRQYRNELGWKLEKVSLLDMGKLMFWAIGGYFLWNFVEKSWDKYRRIVRASTDHEKFDDMLRMTISGNPEQRKQLAEFLDIYSDVGNVAYGMHVAKASLMTCLVFDRFGRQVHFVDADGGGYAMAAKGLKKQLKERAPETLPFRPGG